jgi:type IV pilus assembly protein PilW
MKRHQHGFSLMELMVALTLGLLVVLALVTVFINVNRNNTEMVRNNSVIEGGRFTLQLLEADLSHAGFWAGFVPQFDDLSRTDAPTDRPTAIPDPCLAYNSTNWNAGYLSQLIGIPIQVYEVSSTGAAPTIGTCALLPNAKANTHVVVVRHAAPCVASSTSSDQDCTMENGAIYFQTYRCAATTSPASGYMFTAATSATLANFNLTNRDCSTVADRHKFVSNVYWVRTYASTVGDGIPTLMRSTFKLSGGVPQHVASDALVEGVEGFRVDLGIDNVSRSGASLTAANFDAAVAWASPSDLTTPTNRGDGSADTYVQCTGSSACTALQLMNVVAVRLNVLVRAPTRTPGYGDVKTYTMGSGTNAITLGPFNDNYKRHLYTQVVRLTNVSMRREVAP